MIWLWGTSHFLSVKRTLKIKMVEKNHFNGLQTLGHFIWTIISTHPKQRLKPIYLAIWNFLYTLGKPILMLPDYLLLLISQRSPDPAPLQCKEGAQSDQHCLAAPWGSMYQLCILPAPFHEGTGMGAKKSPTKQTGGEKTPTMLSTLSSFYSPLRNKLSLTNSVSFFSTSWL